MVLGGLRHCGLTPCLCSLGRVGGSLPPPNKVCPDEHGDEFCVRPVNILYFVFSKAARQTKPSLLSFPKIQPEGNHLAGPDDSRSFWRVLHTVTLSNKLVPETI